MVYTAWRWRWCWRGWAFVWFARQRYPPLLSRCFCEHNFQGGLSIRNEFTACSVDLLGFASGFDAMIQLSRCRMNCLSMVRFCCRPMKLPIILSVDSSGSAFREHSPSLSKKTHSTISATPTAKSLPVGHAKSIVIF